MKIGEAAAPPTPFLKFLIRCGLNELFLLPYATKKTPHKAYDAERPVNLHGYPYADYTHTELLCQQVSESNTKQRHGKAGNRHGKARVVGSA